MIGFKDIDIPNEGLTVFFRFIFISTSGTNRPSLIRFIFSDGYALSYGYRHASTRSEIAYYKPGASSWNDTYSTKTLTLSTNTIHRLAVFINKSGLKFYVNGTLAHDISAITTSTKFSYIHIPDTWPYDAYFDDILLITGNAINKNQTNTSYYYLQRELTPYETFNDNDNIYGK